ncbi:MAG TPA: hypothetical protein VNZ22_18400, partial [Bacillota bacterium]|nr:hypothetical protein [Bacillota bacterium]
AQEVTINLSGSGSSAAGTKATPLSPEDRASYTRLNRSELELSTQIKLLTDLADEHAKRSEEATKKEAPEKAKWEGERAAELRDKGATLLSQLNEITKQRLAFETSHSPVNPAEMATGALEEGKAGNSDEFIFLTRLDESLVKTRQELLALVEATKGLHAELQTNNTVEAMTRVSALVEQNERQQRLLQREQSDLELRKLEFRALRKAR